jgi:hypothetical protein
VDFPTLKERLDKRMTWLGIKVGCRAAGGGRCCRAQPRSSSTAPLPAATPPHLATSPQVKHIEEEEYCLIPMGGVLPTHPQRVLGIGGTAGMVHPSTGFMVSRMLGAAPQLADSIVEQLSSPADKAADTGGWRPGWLAGWLG